MRFSKLTGRISGEGADVWQIHELAVERVRRGEEIFLLSIGDPDFATPAPIREALIEALARGRTHYPPCGGEPALRQALARQASAQLGRPVGAEEVVVYPGAQAALFAVAQCLFDPGDEVIVPEPTYMTYEAVIGAPASVMVRVPLRPENGFHLDPDDIARAITPRTRGVLLNFPNNPTGAILTRDEAAAVAELCRRHDLALISDEVYAALDFTGKQTSPAVFPGMAERSAVVSSFSKSHAMTGWRCGWAVVPRQLATYLTALSRCMYFGITTFVQDAAVVALEVAGHEVTAIRDAYRARARVVADRLAGIPGIRCGMPEAGMYLFADVRDTGMDGKRFARELLDAAGVAVTPGEGFGPSGAGHVRITLGSSEERLGQACNRIAAFVRDRFPLQLTGRR